MLAPSNVQFFNKRWRAIGDKRMLARTLENITGVSEHILTDGLAGDCPAVRYHVVGGQSDDDSSRGQSLFLMGLLGVNMPMSRMEKKRKHFTVFSWKSSARRTTRASLHGIGTEEKCELAISWQTTQASSDPDEFITSLSLSLPKGEIEKDRLGTFHHESRHSNLVVPLADTPLGLSSLAAMSL